MAACCALTKKGTTTVVPASPGTPGFPGKPATPAYCAWVPKPAPLGR